MISVRDAFSSVTTTTMTLYKFLDGYWDEENQWQSEGYADPVTISGTPIPIGERQTGTHGENLTPDLTGERVPASMKFTSRVPLDLNDVITYGGINYKMSRKGNFAAAGYYTNVGITISTFNGGEINV